MFEGLSCWLLFFFLNHFCIHLLDSFEDCLMCCDPLKKISCATTVLWQPGASSWSNGEVWVLVGVWISEGLRKWFSCIHIGVHSANSYCACMIKLSYARFWSSHVDIPITSWLESLYPVDQCLFISLKLDVLFKLACPWSHALCFVQFYLII